MGGPVVLPGGLNRSREKLFFFWSQEFWPLITNQPIAQRTVPNGAERRGDFSQTLDVNNRVTTVRDPVTRQPYPGNIIPPSQTNASGLALLGVFPQPNFTNRAVSGGRYNYVFQAQNRTPLRTHTGKVDYNLNSRNSIASSFTLSSDINEGGFGLPGTNRPNWEQMIVSASRPGRIFTGRYTRVIDPTMVNELNVGFSQRPELDTSTESEIDRNRREKVGFRVPQLTPASNPVGVIPNASFGGISSLRDRTHP